MKNVVVIYGGKSPEHDISILTGLHLAKHITDDYRVVLVYMTKDNAFVQGSTDVNDYISGKAVTFRGVYFANGALYKRGLLGKKICEVYCVINCCHGGAGEDGRLAAMLEIADIPFTGCDFISAYNQQSKIKTREMLTAEGFIQPKFTAVSKSKYVTLTDPIGGIDLPFPVIIKPDSLGSSIGISVANTKEELVNGLRLAFSLCEYAVVEEFIPNMREVNIAVMRHNKEIIVSLPEAVGGEKLFSFDEKYMNAHGEFGKKGSSSYRDEFLEKVAPQISKLAKTAYEIFGSCGVVRTDCFVTDEKIILNENNTVPGFMAYNLWVKSDVPYGVVIDDIIAEAIVKHQKKRDFITEFSSNALIKNKALCYN
jgi:D-alanine-D-alanine ligase